MLVFVNWLLTLPRYNEHFGSFPENSLNRDVRYNEQISQSLGTLLNRGSTVVDFFVT